MGDTYRPGVGGGLRRRGAADDTYVDPYRDSGYHFRGAAGDSYRPPQQDSRDDFSFRSQHQGPRFPQEQPSQRPQRQARGNQGRKRGGQHKPRGQPYRRFGRAAHERDLLKRANRETTPEQLAGMNADNSQKYAEVISDSSDEESDVSEDEDTEASHKRAKTSQDVEASVPKWSNPDPYSVLPPTDMGIGPKKDIVQVIRKSKLDAAAQNTSTNAVKENVDFISFDDFVDDNESSDETDEDDGGIMIHDSMGPPPTAPPGLVMPSDEELMRSYVGAHVGSKRKRGLEPSSVAAGIVEEWQPIPGVDPTPWYRNDQPFKSNVGLHRLHMEIVDFYEYVRPHRHEAEIRNDVIDRVERQMRGFKNTRGNVVVESFGSFACGLYLPTADMDLVAISPSYQDRGIKSFGKPNFIFGLKHYLDMRGIARRDTCVPVPRAKVPILKFVDDLTGIKVDISFDNDTGLQANRTFKQWKAEFPQMPPLVVLIKQILAMHGLNEVHTGGIGGFTTICLVVSMLQLMPSEQRDGGDQEALLARLLMHFLDFYGNKFNLRTTGIRMNPPGHFDKQRTQTLAKVNAEGLTIIDPNRKDNDISGGSKRVAEVFGLFRRAHAALQRRAEEVVNGSATSGSILGCVLGGNYTSFDDARDRLSRLDRDSRGRAYPRRTPSPAADAYQSSYQSYQQPLPPARNYYESYNPPAHYSQRADYRNVPPMPDHTYQSYQPSYDYAQPLPPLHAQSYGAPPPSTLPPPHHSLPVHPHLGQQAAQPSQFQPINEPPANKKKKKTKGQKKQEKAQKIAQTEPAAPKQKKSRKSKSEKKAAKKSKGAKANNKNA